MCQSTQAEVAEPMDDEMFVPYSIVIPTAAEEPLSCSPIGQSHLSNQLDSMNFERFEPHSQVFINRPFPSYLLPLFQNEALSKTFHRAVFI